MRTVASVEAMRGAVNRWHERRQGIGFVPTMGYLHEGHISLVKRARKAVGRSGKVVVSIYVNPTQFGPAEDLTRYPRDLERDSLLCREAGVDVLFVPQDQEMYPGRSEGAFTTYVAEEKLSRGMEGASRPTHFRGVTTVVAKLFNIVQPQVAVFGAKDYQQAAIIRRMTLDLNFPVKIIVGETVREPDGLAMSSRNKYLEADLHRQALVLWRSIQLVKGQIRDSSRPLRAGLMKEKVARLVREQPDARLDYVEFFNPETLEPIPLIAPGAAHMALAVFIGNTRLIDNTRL